VILWIATALAALPIFAAGLPKLLGQGGWVHSFAHWGLPSWLVPVVGAAEVLGVAALLIPRTATAGAALIAVIMIGAATTHAVHGETPRVVFTSILCIVSLSIGWARRESLRRSLPSGRQPNE
jgi:uncharacterized membrane protein YphA (DoxX/SURF4 family)